MSFKEKRTQKQQFEAAKDQIQHANRAITFRNRLPATLSNQFSLMSWNILNEFACTPQKFNKCPARELVFSRRLEKITAVIRSSNLDIICFQELDCVQFMEQFSFLKQEGFDFVLQKRNKKLEDLSSEKQRELQPMSLATAFRVSKFSLAWSVSKSRVLSVGLKLHHSDVTLCVVNCHLEAAPHKEAIRLRQLDSTFATIAPMAPASGVTVVCGDFNSLPASKVYSHVLKRSFSCSAEKGATTHEPQSVPLRSAYCEALGKEPEATYIGHGDNGETPHGACVDYIFFSHTSAKLIGVTRLLDTPSLQVNKV
jgi:mRNA deadenylase 3'-5' endonuclease subunit Ccr4